MVFSQVLSQVLSAYLSDVLNIFYYFSKLLAL